jgi:hypothetical protein
METPGSVVNNELPCGSGDPAAAGPFGWGSDENPANR